ncbi:Pleckstrin y domain [Dermatophagoides pteronyssinus]|uniref:Pleckstrin y domain n=1 Tax=Dermatophagoides pteronyssinus TaxID=6956 RepID=A0ABQ8IXH5_DERPT|nr:Pleckstrin y domain [Dermatophagoides pteronyssinus]
MHPLFVEVLSKKDLSRAGELFAIDDRAIVKDLSELLATIKKISNSPYYIDRHNDQSVVEICLTRIISAIRDTNTIEEHARALVALLESCLLYNLKPTNRDQDPPHAKIASEVVSFIFLNHSKKSVMCLAVPVAVKLLHRGNKELSRNLSSYLSLAAIHNADLLAPYIQPIIDSIISGNYSLVRVLSKIYVINKEPIHDHIMALVCLLPQCDTSEKSSLLNLFALISKHKPSILEDDLHQLSDCLQHPQTAYTTMQIFLDMAHHNNKKFIDYIPRVIASCEIHSGMVSIAAEFLGIVGKLNISEAQDCVRFLTSQLSKSDLGTTITLLKQIKSIAEVYPSVLPNVMSIIIAQTENSTSSTVQSYLQQLNVINQTNNSSANRVNSNSDSISSTNLVNNLVNSVNKNSFLSSDISSLITAQHHQQQSIRSTNTNSNSSSTGGKLGGNSGFHIWNRSIPRLHVVSGGSQIHNQPPSNVHRSLTALVASAGGVSVVGNGGSGSGNNGANTGGGSSSSNTASRHYMNRMSIESMNTTNTPSSSQKSASSSYLLALQEKELATKNVNSSIDSQLQQQISGSYTLKNNSSRNELNFIGGRNSGNNGIGTGSIVGKESSKALHHHHHHHHHVISSDSNSYSPMSNAAVSCVSSDLTSKQSSNDSRQITVFEPYPMRDAVQHFCEKHNDKIKTYMQKVLVKIPLPVKCTIEEKRSKKIAKIYFACQAKGEHCLYTRNYFVMKTKNARVWIHLMFLALQAKAKSSLCTREPSVNALKNCWETLKVDNKSFLTLVTSNFPSAKDQEILIDELRSNRYFDVFKFNAIMQLWGCFLCNHPDKATGFLKNSEPVIEGQLKEKKGKWKFFRRWRTRYFTLSGIHLYRDEVTGEKDGQPIEVGKVQSVRAVGNSRGRTIPKAFEIFTNDKTYILKAKNSQNNQEWMQCLSIAMAHSQAKDQ